MINPLSNPLTLQAKWQTDRIAPKDLSYESAVKAFEQDEQFLRSQDRDSSSLTSPGLRSPWRKPSSDRDGRPGEVDCPGTGYLMSTPEGAALKTIQEPQFTAIEDTRIDDWGGSRFYNVNQSQGTITVVNTCVGDLAPGSSKPGYIETYTIDNEARAVTDYTRRTLGASE